MSGRKGADQALHKRFEAEEQQAIDAPARWIGHLAVRGIIERRKIGAETVVMPVAHLLTCQSEVMRFCWHVYGMAGIEPGWVLRRGKPWLLTVSQMNVIGRVEADFRGVVQLAVNELEGAGVALVPRWKGDHVVVGELLLLDADWDKPPRELAEDLQPPAIGAIHFDASARSTGAAAGNAPATTSVRCAALWSSTGTVRRRVLPTRGAARVPCPNRHGDAGRHWARSSNGSLTPRHHGSPRPSPSRSSAATACRRPPAGTCASSLSTTTAASCAARRRAPCTRISRH